jgi:hypothetical protein
VTNSSSRSAAASSWNSPRAGQLRLTYVESAPAERIEWLRPRSVVPGPGFAPRASGDETIRTHDHGQPTTNHGHTDETSILLAGPVDIPAPLHVPGSVGLEPRPNRALLRDSES